MKEFQNIRELLSVVQCELKAPKTQKNAFGGYMYRNVEDIDEALKPLMAKYNFAVICPVDIELVGDRYYLKATATMYYKDEVITSTALAREDDTRKGMASEQITGSATSYARKYALNGLFCLDDTKDADSMDNTASGAKQSAPKPTAQAQAPQPKPEIKKVKISMTQVGESLFGWIDKKMITLKQLGKTMSASDIVKQAYEIDDAVAEHIDMEYRYHVRKQGGKVTAEKPSALEQGALEFNNKSELI